MLKITIKNLLSETICGDEKSGNLLALLLDHTDVMHACGGKGRCTTCKVRVLARSGDLPEDSVAETRFRSLGRLGANERLSCQFLPLGELVLEIPNTSKLPHLSYKY